MDSQLLTIMKNVREIFFNDFNHQVFQNYKHPLKKNRVQRTSVFNYH